MASSSASPRPSAAAEHSRKILGFMAHAKQRKDSFIQFFAMTVQNPWPPRRHPRPQGRPRFSHRPHQQHQERPPSRSFSRFHRPLRFSPSPPLCRTTLIPFPSLLNWRDGTTTRNGVE
ncbi:hypothetical protein GmHk_04G009247 [Glycine max]|nr:hypothetical protein GmHk_04G009247 [Glycine max]